jgi:hypothetical protein
MRECKHGVGAKAANEAMSIDQRVHTDWVRALMPTDLMDMRARPVDAGYWRVEASC